MVTLSNEEWWSLDTHIARVFIEGCTKLRDEGCSYPSTITYEEWKSILTEIINGFQAHLKLVDMDGRDGQSWEEWSAPLVACRDRAIDLVKEYFGNLWD